MNIKQLSINEITLLKPLWIKLNKHLETGSHYFKPELGARTFETRIEPYLKRAETAPCLIQAVYDNGRMIGYSLASIDEEGVGEIDSLYLEPKFQKKGMGEQLVLNMLEFFDKNNTVYDRLNVTEGNFKVEKFYEKFGFRTRKFVMYRVKK